MKLTQSISKHNFFSLLWHAGFLALAKNFMDVDTVVPAMLVESGGSAIHIGFMTSIMLGGSSLTQLIFAPFVSNYHFKKKLLLLSVNSRIFSLLGLGFLLLFLYRINGSYVIFLIFLLITIFSLGGAFSNVSYTDILGKSVLQHSRKSYFSLRQVITGIMLLISALLAKKTLTALSYPVNYSYLFFIAFASLFIASLGFWNLKEVIPSRMHIKSPGHFFTLVKSEIIQNKKLGFFLGYINTMGICITFLPFMILYAKEFYHLQSSDTGLFLLYKIIGSVATGFILFFFAGWYKYRYLLYGSAVLAFVLPLLLFLPVEIPSFAIIFFTGGIMISIYTISMNGVLLEVSGTENRSLYTGITGAGNILPFLFPILGGWIVKNLGFQPFFILFMTLIFSSLFFINKINCEK